MDLPIGISILVPVTLFGWIPVVLVLFASLTPRRAVLFSTIFAWLFLPMYGYAFEGFPEYTKVTATTLGITIGVVLFDAGRLMAFRFHPLDSLILIWCFCPFVSAATNGFGMYDGMSFSIEQILAWGLPYFIGRLYFSDLEGLRELAISIFIGGLIYLPLCLYEIKMSPQLHNILYGFHAHSFLQTSRGGGWRPTVFMQHGLMVGMWMAGATLVGTWLWFSGVLKRVAMIPMWLLVMAMFITTILCKSTGATVLLLAGCGLLFSLHITKFKWLMYLAVLMPALYIGGRIMGWDAREVISAAQVISEDRAQSVQFRVSAEKTLVNRARKRFFFGWAGFARNRPEGIDVITDSMWIIAFGTRGIVGLVALTLPLLLTGVLLLRRVPINNLANPIYGSAVAITVLIVIYAYDNLFNAMINPIFIIALGGALGFGVRGGHPAPREVMNTPSVMGRV